MKRLLPWTLVSVIAFSSCAKLGKVEQKDKQVNPISPFGKPIIRSGSSDAGTPVIAGGNASPGSAVSGEHSKLNLTPESDIAYTDPDNPDADVPGLSDLLSQARRGPWEQSETIAKQLSMREGKPLLILFTDSQSNPMCKAVSEELFSTNDFGKWATEKLVRLKVDAFVDKEQMKDLTIDEATQRTYAIQDFNGELKKRYKIMGYPSMIMVSPSGEVVGRYRGYKRGDADFVWGQLKHAESVSSEATKGWRTGLEKKGYREWQDRKGRKVFAKLTSYSKGTLTLIEPDGTRSRTTEDKLSDEDKSWIVQQKTIRNIR